MKKLLSGIFAVSFLLTACNQTSQNILIPNDLYESTQFMSNAKNNSSTIRSDWFEALNPELQKYYAPARGKTGAELFDSLHDIISKNNKQADYGSTKSFMYSTVDNINVNGRTGLFDAYSYVFVPGNGGNGNSYKESGDPNQDGKANDFINCEHTWPQSFFDKKAPMVSDLHHMFPTLSVPNEMRNHFPIGMVAGKVPYTTNGGSKLSLIDKTGKNRSVEEMKKILDMPHEEKSPILDNEFTIAFEPGDRQKGNTARALMYFYLRYYNQGIKKGTYNEVDFWDSKVSTFINWSENVDAVDAQEIKRHEIAFRKQNNRNPFIDIPGLGTLISAEVLKTK